MLSVHQLQAFYGDFQALFGIDLVLHDGEIVAVIGANGAGKSTLLRTVCGEIRSRPEAVSFAGQPIGGLPAYEILARGIALVPEGRRLFPSLTVEENLLIGSFSRRAGPWNLQRVYALFPLLARKRHALSTTLSGGEQQMTAIGRALMSNPKVLLCDELSLGLAPAVVKSIYEALPLIRAEGATVVVVEQDIETALRVADRVYCFMHGRISLHGKAAELSQDRIAAAYFGF